MKLRLLKILKALSPICIIAGDLYSLPSAALQSPDQLIYDSREIYTQLAGLKGIVLKGNQNVFLERKKCISFANKNKMFITVK